MDKLFQIIVELLANSAASASNSPSKKGMYEEEMPEAVKQLKKY